MILFLKSLTFILWNIALGVSLVYIFKCLLFNKKARYIFKWRIPMTPGFFVQKRDWIFSKARDILHDYLRQAEDFAQRNGYLAKWERLVHDAVWEKTNFIDEWKYIPAGIKDKLHAKLSDLAKSLASTILRKLVPRLIEQLRIEHLIDDYDFKLSVEFFYGYFKKYVYKPLLLAFLAINFLIGLMNMILYLIVAPL
ncbi:MAG TPA: hypothetical protein PL124_06305 [Candidatus Cloacimonadota bacterium]|nr:hypothetical protein [Candidatus Cloacimonadota bacterium]HPS39007.1 hypothetical protein [Candidatus Cloacimonadota bacterium]